MRLGSLFDGIGGFPLAASRHGITPVWASEIEPDPIKVTKRHFPDMVHYGDVTQIHGGQIEPVDVITFGSPCQDLSVAGKRAGLDGERSGLFGAATRIIREMRLATGGQYPRFAVWENVPGAFSSNKGEDFRVVIEELCRIKDPDFEVPPPPKGRWQPAGMVDGNGWSVAWRVLDAQYWGVPQRRKRIFVVADFTSGSAGEVLFKQESVRGYSAESSGEREGVAVGTQRGIDCTGEDICLNDQGGQSISIDYGLSPTLRSEAHGNLPCVVRPQIPFMVGNVASTPRAGAGAPKHGADENGRLVVHPQITGTLCDSGAGMSRPAGMASETDLVVCQPIPINDKATRYKGGGDTRNNDGSGNGLGVGKPGDPMPTLTQCDRHSIAYAVRMREGCDGGGKGPLIQTEKSGTRATGNDQTIFAIDRASFNQGKNAQYDFQIGTDDKTQTVVARGPNAVAVSPTYAVRRLTPLECERLQGFPDGWTDGLSDTARYKALGNSVAIPCVEYIMEGLYSQWMLS